MKKNLIKSIFFLNFVLWNLIILLPSCKTEGCTDPKANNFSYEAQKDDGSCNYGGCTDEQALNFDKDAKYNNGTCIYYGDVKIFTSRTLPGTSNNKFISVFVSSEYIGSLSSSCNNTYISCTTGCDMLNFDNKTSGIYSYKYYEIQQLSASVFDTIYESANQSFQVIGGQCTAVNIE